MKEYTLTTVQAGELVGKHHTTIARYIREGMLDAIEVDAPRWTPKLRVNRDDVLAIWEAKKAQTAQRLRSERKSQVKLRKTNSSKRTSHRGEVWQIKDRAGIVAYTGTFGECLKEKPGIETDTGQYHTMEMVGGRRVAHHDTSLGAQLEQIDRYNFGTV